MHLQGQLEVLRVERVVREGQRQVVVVYPG